MSPRGVFPSRVMVPLSQPVSLVGQMAFFGNACDRCVRSSGIVVVHISTPSCALADLPFSFGLCLPAAGFPRVLWVPSSQPVSLVGQMAFFGNACEGCVRSSGIGVVHIPAPSCALADLSLVGYVSPPRVSIPCHSSFVAACEFGCANGVVRQCMRGLCEELWHWCGAHTCPILCTCRPFSRGLCLPATCFHPVSFFLRRSM